MGLAPDDSVLLVRDTDLASRQRVTNRAQLQPTKGPKWAFGQTLKELRQEKGMSQEQLAEAAGLDRSFVSLVERGIQSPNIVVLLKIAEVLGVPAAAFVAETESKMRSVATRTAKPQKKPVGG
jgi:DNA-binding XRE family transcriptional regulator